MENKLSPGDPAPAIVLPDQDNRSISLAELKGQKVLIYFYPKADTPGCTTQACSVRDHHDRLDTLKVARLGISPDPPDKQKKFADKYDLNFPLLCDEDHRVAEAYGVWGEKKNFGKTYFGIIRSAFLVDEEGRLERVWYKVSPGDTVPNVLKAVEG